MTEKTPLEKLEDRVTHLEAAIQRFDRLLIQIRAALYTAIGMVVMWGLGGKEAVKALWSGM